MLFNVFLFPLDTLIADTVSAKPDRRLSWFDLTVGYYWIDVGNVHLFQYSQAICEKWQLASSTNECYADYYVSFFWADILERLPVVLEPVPAPLAQRLSAFPAWINWLATRDDWINVRDEDGDDATLEEQAERERNAVDWWSERRLDTSYLRAGPNIVMWSDGTSMHIVWDNRALLLDGASVWEAQAGQIDLPLKDFLTEVQAFDQQFLKLMAQRVVQAQGSKYMEDLFFLQQAQQQKEHALENALREAEQRSQSDWHLILDAIAAVDNDPLFARLYKERTLS